MPKPDMDHLEFIKLLLEHGADPERAYERQHADPDDLHDAVVPRGGRDAVHPRRAVERHVADEAAARLRRRSDAHDRPRRHGADRSGGIGWVEGVTYERSPKENIEAVQMLLDLGLDPNAANNDGRTALMGAAMKGRSEVVQMLVDKGARLDTRDKGSRDTDTTVSVNAGHTWQALDYADGLVRVGVQSAVNAARDGGAHSQADEPSAVCRCRRPTASSSRSASSRSARNAFPRKTDRKRQRRLGPCARQPRGWRFSSSCCCRLRCLRKRR